MQGALNIEDYYDKAVAYFTEHPRRIQHAWLVPRECVFGKLFAFCDDQRGGLGQCEDGKSCGCPVMIRECPEAYSAKTLAVRKLVLECEDLPISSQVMNHLAVPYLEAFARLQRRIDAELGRTPPVWVEPGDVA